MWLHLFAHQVGMGVGGGGGSVLGDDYADSVDNLLSASPAGSYMDVFTTFDPTVGPSTFNTNLWGGNGDLVDWTPILWKNSGDTRACRGIAITKRHVITSMHTTYIMSPGDTVYFIAADGTSVSRTISAVADYVSSANVLDSFHICYLSSDLPASITPAPLMADRSTNMVGLPIVRLDYEHHASVANVATNSDSGLAMTDPLTGTRHTYYEDWISGDSSSPACYLVGAQLIYATSAVTGGGGQGPNVATRIGAILEACYALDMAGAQTNYRPTMWTRSLAPGVVDTLLKI